MRQALSGPVCRAFIVIGLALSPAARDSMIGSDRCHCKLSQTRCGPRSNADSSRRFNPGLSGTPAPQVIVPDAAWTRRLRALKSLADDVPTDRGV